MEKKSYSLSQTGLYLFTAISLSLLIFFREAILRERDTQALITPESQNNLILDHSFELNIPLHPVSSCVMPSQVDRERAQIFRADFLGGPGSETALVTGNFLYIFDKAGNVQMEKRLPSDKLYPFLTADTDGDGKKEILLGSSRSPRNEVISLNGTGSVISRFSEETGSHDFSSLSPVAIADRELYVLARPEEKYSPRGIIKLSLPDLRLKSMFYAPDPINLTFLSDRQEGFSPIIISYVLHSSGLFKFYGKPENPLITADFEINGMLLMIDRQGTPREEHIILENKGKQSGGMIYFEGSGQRIYLINNSDDSYRLFAIDSRKGEILSASNENPGTYKDFRTGGDEDSYDILVLSHYLDNEGEIISLFRFYDSLGHFISEFHLPGEMHSGPVLSALGQRRNHFFIAANGVYLLRGEEGLEKVIDQEEVKQMILFEEEDQVYAQLLTAGGIFLYSMGKI